MYLYNEQELDFKIFNRMSRMPDWGMNRSCLSFDESRSWRYASFYKVERQEKKKKRSRSAPRASHVYVQGVLCPRYLRANDHVMISIPEDMQIHGIVSPELNGRLARVISTCEPNIDVEVVVELLTTTDLDQTDTLMANPGQTQQERSTITVPIFCLCLENNLLKERMSVDGLECSFVP